MARITPIEFPPQPIAFDISAQPEVRLSDGSPDVVYNGARRMVIWAENATGGDVVLTIDAARVCIHGDLHPAPVTVPDGFSGYLCRELPYDRFNDSGHDVTITYDVGGLLVAAVVLD